MKRIYLDYAATTPVAPEVIKAMQPYLEEKYGNASAIHSFGREAREAIESARRAIAKSINCEPGELIFTSGGTESNNLAIKGVTFAKKGHIITTKIEHDCVLNAVKWLEKQGYKITFLDVDKEGFIDLKQLEKEIRRDTILVSIIHGNNEIGTIQNLEAIGKICRKNKVCFHTDACQSYTKVPIDVRAMNIDLLTVNAHKIYGPKGVGALYIRNGVKMDPLAHGGGHEFGKRSGTENTPGIVGFAEASKLDVKDLRELQKYTYDKVMELKDVIFNGPSIGSRRLPNNLNFAFKYIEGEALQMLLDDAGVAVSTGSACSSRSLETSHVLRAIGLKHVDANGAIRVTIGRYTTKEDIDYFVDALKKAVDRLRRMSPFGK